MLTRAPASAAARVSIVHGPVTIDTPDNCECIRIDSANDMLEACLALAPECDVFIACAAVADYRPAQIADQKIKKGAEEITLTMVRNPDIVASIAGLAQRPFTVGFAAETTDVLSYARDKMLRKKLDMIIANDVSDASVGFNSEQNEVTVITPEAETPLEKANKSVIANKLIALVAQSVNSR